jgi:hypothetical protein
MKPQYAAYPSYVSLLLACLFQAPLALGQEPSLPAPSHPTSDSAVAQGDDGMWIEMPPPTARSSHAAIYDPRRERMVVFGGFDGTRRNDGWALSLSRDPDWNQLRFRGPLPSARYYHTAIHDPLRHRMVVFGGYDGSRRNDVWVLSLSGRPTWIQLIPSGIPPPVRLHHSAIYDPVRDRMLVFGGFDGSARNDVWALTFSGDPAWSELITTGIAPPEPYGHSAVYDPVRDRMVVFGEQGGSSNDVWALSLSGTPAWSELVPSGTSPSSRSYHTAVYDPPRDRMVVFGGVDSSGYRNDVWAMAFSGSPSWSELTPAGNAPPPRSFHIAVYDPVRDQMVVFGGYGAHLNDAWALSLSGSKAWSELSSGSPPFGRSRPTAFYDPVRHRMIVFRGVDWTGRNRVWALSLTGRPRWSELSPTGSGPPAGPDHTAIYDPVRDRMVVFTGARQVVGRNEVWALSLSGSPVWSQLAPTGDAPPRRAHNTAIYDPVRDRMVVFGGQDGRLYHSDVWSLSLSESPAWSQLSPVGAPTARAYHTAIYDPVRDRMIVFGGRGAGSGYREDVWALSFSESPAWSQLPPAGNGRSYHSAIYDSERDRMVVFGGNAPGHVNDVWALSLSGDPAWNQLIPAGTPPSPRSDHAAIYDPENDRMMVFGGGDLVLYRNDVWALAWNVPPSRLSVSLSLSVLWPPNHRLVNIRATVVAEGVDPEVSLASITSSEPDSGTSRDDVPGDIQGAAFGTADYDFQLRSERADSQGRTYTVCYEADDVGGTVTQCEVVRVSHERRGTAQLDETPAGLEARVQSNPARGRAWIHYALPQAGHVRLDVYDASGRLRARLADGWLRSGWHATSFEGGASSQLYFYRLEWNGRSLTGKLAIVR